MSSLNYISRLSLLFRNKADIVKTAIIISDMTKKIVLPGVRG